jgi:hypothetical protein
MKIELSESMREWLQQQAALRGFATPDALVECIVQTARERYQKRLEGALLEAIEAIENGDSVEGTPEFWEDQRRKLEDFIGTLGKAAG